jgi:uncharacterized protein (DUF1697 family)
MPKYLAFLRGINLGKRRIKMPDLKAVVEQLPVSDVSTFIASGNVIFTSRQSDPRKLEQKLSTHLETQLGYSVDVVIRTPKELSVMVNESTLGELWADKPLSRTHVTLHAEPINPEDSATLNACRTPTDAFHVIGREVYWRCAGKMTDSTVWKTPALKSLNLPAGTNRNLNTLQKLANLHPA